MDMTNTVKRDFLDLRVRAELLDLCGDGEGARRLRSVSLEIGLEVEVNCYAYQLLWRSRFDDAIDLLRWNAENHPDSWNALDSLAEAYELKGDLGQAIENYALAARLVEHPGHQQRLKRRLSELRALGIAS